MTELHPKIMAAKALKVFMESMGDWARDFIPPEEAARSHDRFLEAYAIIMFMGDYAGLGLPQEVEDWYDEILNPPPVMYL